MIKVCVISWKSVALWSSPHILIIVCGVLISHASSARPTVRGQNVISHQVLYVGSIYYLHSSGLLFCSFTGLVNFYIRPIFCYKLQTDIYKKHCRNLVILILTQETYWTACANRSRKTLIIPSSSRIIARENQRSLFNMLQVYGVVTWLLQLKFFRIGRP